MELSLRTRVRAGDPDAFAELFDSCARKVYNHAFRMTGKLVNRTGCRITDIPGGLAAAHKRPRGRRTAQAVDSWYLRQHSAESLASRTAAPGRDQPDATPSSGPDFADDVAGRLDDAARIAEVRLAIAALNRGERDVFALCVWSGLDYAMAAEALGVPIGTVRSRLSRARRKLQRQAASPRLSGTFKHIGNSVGPAGQSECKDKGAAPPPIGETP